MATILTTTDEGVSKVLDKVGLCGFLLVNADREWCYGSAHLHFCSRPLSPLVPPRTPKSAAAERHKRYKATQIHRYSTPRYSIAGGGGH